MATLEHTHIIESTSCGSGCVHNIYIPQTGRESIPSICTSPTNSHPLCLSVSLNVPFTTYKSHYVCYTHPPDLSPKYYPNSTIHRSEPHKTQCPYGWWWPCLFGGSCVISCSHLCLNAERKPNNTSRTLYTRKTLLSGLGQFWRTIDSHPFACELSKCILCGCLAMARLHNARSRHLQKCAGHLERCCILNTWIGWCV